MKKNIIRTAWLTIAGSLLAILPLSAHAQYPGNPGDNGTGVMPMAPMQPSEIPRYGSNYGVVPKPPYEPKAATRPAGWVGGTAFNPQPNNIAGNSSAQQPTNPQTIPNAPQAQYPQTLPNAPVAQYPQTTPYSQSNPYPPTNPYPADSGWRSPQQANAVPNLQNPPLYPSTDPNYFVPPTVPQNIPQTSPQIPLNPPLGQTGDFNRPPVRNEVLNQSGEAVPAPELIQGTITIARIGSEAVFASEITPWVDKVMAQFLAQIPPAEAEAYRDDIELRRTQLMKGRLKQYIESKLIFQDAKRTIPPEGMVGVEKQLNAKFDESMLPPLLKSEGVTTTKELDQKLKAQGSSIAKEKKNFMEKAIVGEWVRRQTKHEDDVTVAERLRYYETHLADFTTSAKARWEEISVSKLKYNRPEEAYAAIAQLGNRVLMGGEPLAEVAKQGSDGFTASKGGLRDWVSKGSLTDKEIDAALFGLPVGQLSPIIETRDDYNIIRVVERVDQRTVPFVEAQIEIPKKIKEERSERLLKEYLEELERRTPIWTIYDGDGGNLKFADRLNENTPSPATQLREAERQRQRPR